MHIALVWLGVELDDGSCVNVVFYDWIDEGLRLYFGMNGGMGQLFVHWTKYYLRID